jgi:HlyD family secretion protein
LCAVAGAAALWWLNREPETANFLTSAVERAPIVAAVTATGTLNAVTTVQVGTYVSGRVQEILVDFNSRVRRGQVVARIDPAPFQMKVNQARAALATARARRTKAEADMRFRKSELDRQRALIDRNVIAQDSLDAVENAFHQAEASLALEDAGIAQADAALAESRINLDYTDIVSPVDGVVLSRAVDVGQTVAASFQTPTLFLIAEDLAEMRVNANISESDIGRIVEGQAVRFVVDAYPEREFAGVVSQRRDAPIIQNNVVTYDVVIDVDNADLALKPGMTATVAITTSEKGEALVVPLRALRFRPDLEHRESDGEAAEPDKDRDAELDRQPHVWLLLDDSTLRRVGLEVGIRSDEYAEVLSGDIAAGDPLAIAYERE